MAEKEELTRRDHDFPALLADHGIDRLLKPLVREIHLFDTFVAGTSMIPDPGQIGNLTVGSKLVLRREISRFSDNEVSVFTEAGQKLGRIPEKDTVIFARLMDAGKALFAKVIGTKMRGSVPVISIGIWMEEF